MTQVVLFDVMGTLVHDPFFVEVPRFFGTDLRTLVSRKHPTAWESFELGHIDEEGLAQQFFADGRRLDVEGLKRAMVDAYAFLPGIPDLLADLQARGVAMHTLSNYPRWYQLIEAKLELSRWVPWTFVSCEMGARKPDLGAYTHAAQHLGVTPQQCLFVDDRQINCDAAHQAGMDAVRFTDAVTLREALATRGLV
jgi:HAD superfamily hydrolase (TIGR01509 family)